jgi:ribosomal protein S17
MAKIPLSHPHCGHQMKVLAVITDPLQVEIIETRPVSKEKRWAVKSILKKSAV